jgi:hypothetical protein
VGRTEGELMWAAGSARNGCGHRAGKSFSRA